MWHDGPPGAPRRPRPLRAGEGAARRLAHCRRRRDRRRPRRQRRRQDDDAARGLAHRPPRRRGALRRRGGPRRPRCNGAPRRRARARGARHLCRVDRVGEPAPRRLHTARKPEGRLRARTHLLPVARGPAPAAGGNAQRRRAADARTGARVHAATAAAPPRRAVTRSGAAARDGGLPDHQGAERERRRHRARGRAERAHRAPARTDGLRARGRPRRTVGAERRAAGARVRTQELPGVLMVDLARRLPLNRWQLPASPVVLLLAAGAIFLVVGCLQSSIFAQQTVAGLATGAVYGSLALALVLIYRSTEVINFVQGEMAMACAYFTYQLVQWGFSYWEAFFTTLPIALVLGMAIQVTLIRPVQHRSVIAVVIVTVSLFILIDGLVDWRWGADIKFLPSPFGNRVYHVGSVAVARQGIGTIIITLFTVVLLCALFRFTKLGLRMRAAALRPAAASLAGVRVDWLVAIC